MEVEEGGGGKEGDAAIESIMDTIYILDFFHKLWLFSSEVCTKKYF